MFRVYETELSVRTKMEELPTLSEFASAARISDFAVQLEKLTGRMNPRPMGLLSLTCGSCQKHLPKLGITAKRLPRRNLGHIAMTI